jgi:putative hydrolase of the HAD superfamily
MLPIRTVLLDAFGTIIHPEPGWESLRADCLTIVHGTWAGRAIPLRDWMRAYEQARAEQHAKVSEGLREFDFPARFTRTLELCGVPQHEAEAWGPQAHERYHRFQQGLVHTYDSPAPTLAALKKAGYSIALVSNYAHTQVLRDALARLGLLPYFDAVIVSADVGYLKPHERIFQAALDALGARPQDSVMVGNDVGCDIVGAKRAGLHAIWAPYPRVSPAPSCPGSDAVVERLADLPRVIQEMG